MASPVSVIGPFRTERLTLLPISLEDVERLVALDGDPEVMRYLTGGVPTSPDEVVAVIDRTRGTRWVAFAGPGDFVGWFGLVPARAASFELGYRLRREAWSRGLATEGARALVDAAFTRLGARRVFAHTMAVNGRSRRVMVRCGMRHVRTFHLEWDDPIEGADFGEVEYEIDRDHWARRQAEPGGSPGGSPGG